MSSRVSRIYEKIVGYHVHVKSTHTELQKTQLTIKGRQHKATATGNHGDAVLLRQLYSLYDNILTKLNSLHGQLVLFSQQEMKDFQSLKNIIGFCQQKIETTWQEITTIMENASEEITSTVYFNQLVEKLGQLYRKIKDKTPETTDADS